MISFRKIWNRLKPQKRPVLNNKDYVTFSSTGISVDLPRFFATEEGKKRLLEIKRETDRIINTISQI